MKLLAWVFGAAVLVIAVMLGQRILRQPSLGPIVATPKSDSASVRVGETLTFTATADGAVAYAWSVWDREVSQEPVWSFVPGPEEVGWQQVKVVVTGRDGRHSERSWNVGVVVPIAPEVTETVPPPGTLNASSGTQLTFRCSARVPAARETDRIHFEWTLDDVPFFREEHAATGGASQVTVAPNPGAHRLAVHVREVERISSFAEWTIEVAGGPVQMARAEPAPSPTAPPPTAPPPTAPPTAPPPTAPPPTAPPPTAPPPTAPPPTAPPPTAPPPTAPPPTAPPPTAPPPTAPPPTAPPPTAPPPTAPPPTAPPPTAPPPTAPPPTAPPPTAPPTAPPPTAPSPTAPRPTAVPPSTVPPRSGRSPSPPSTVAPAVVARAAPPATVPPAARLVRDPARTEVAMLAGAALALSARVEPPTNAARYRWAVDGRVVQDGAGAHFEFMPIDPGRHRITVSARMGELDVGSGGWSVVARAPVAPAVPPPAPAPAVIAPPPERPPTPPPIVQAAREPNLDVTPPALREDDVRRWLQEYAAAWSRKDVDALRRMGQVRGPNEVDRLERYFRSIDDLRVDVRVLSLHVEGDRAAVEFERTDTVVDPAGQRRELKLPPFRKEIERDGQGLRFAEPGRGR